MVNRHVKLCSTNGNQNHNEILLHICRIAIIKKTRMNNCQEEYGGKGTLLHGWEYYRMATIIEKQTTMKFPQKIKKKYHTFQQFHT